MAAATAPFLGCNPDTTNYTAKFDVSETDINPQAIMKQLLKAEPAHEAFGNFLASGSLLRNTLQEVYRPTEQWTVPERLPEDTCQRVTEHIEKALSDLRVLRQEQINVPTLREETQYNFSIEENRKLSTELVNLLALFQNSPHLNGLTIAGNGDGIPSLHTKQLVRALVLLSEHLEDLKAPTSLNSSEVSAGAYNLRTGL